MKKFIIFLITIIGINSFSLVNVNASSDFFYEGDYIQGIWITKVKGGTKYYQKARFFMLKGAASRFAYCVEPFAMFNENSSYTRSLTANNLTDAQMKRISLIAYFGYVYGSHYNEKWYAITQYMIWKEADPNSDIYFTDGLNGNRIAAYTNEINEINNLINEYLTLPSINNMEINLVEGNNITLNDSNGVISKYKSDDENVAINGNNITINNLKEGEHVINLTRSSKRTTCIPFFFNSNDSQNMFMVGDMDNMNASFKVNVTSTSLELTKIDKDTKNTISSGDASLSGATYQIYDKDMNPLDKLIIDEDMKAKITNLNYGKYYIKEIEAGKGYKLDENLYEFEISTNNTNIKLTLENAVIKKEIQIHKSYGDGITSQNEKNISFDIFHNKSLYTTITTDDNGYASAILPFGLYSIKQKNTTSGYNFTDEFNINIENEDKEEFNLYDYKIKVPNTGKEEISYTILFILIIIGGFYVNKKIFF